MIPFSLYIKVYFWKLWSKVLQIFLLFSLHFSSLNLKYLKFTKMDITRFAMKLYKCYHECWVMIKTLVNNYPGQLSECNIGVKMSTFIHVSSVEGKKGAIKRCSIENQKGAIAVQYSMVKVDNMQLFCKINVLFCNHFKMLFQFCCEITLY